MLRLSIYTLDFLYASKLGLLWFYPTVQAAITPQQQVM